MSRICDSGPQRVKRAIFSILTLLIFKATKHRFVFWSLNVGSANNKGSTVYIQ